MQTLFLRMLFIKKYNFLLQYLKTIINIVKNMALPSPITLSLNLHFSAEEERKIDNMFLKDPKSDIFITFPSKIYPLHRKYMQKSKLIKSMPLSQKFILIESCSDFQMTLFDQMVALFYGKNIQVHTIEQFTKVIEFISFFEVDELLQELQNEILAHLEEYDIFVILNIAFKFSLKGVFNQCIKNLKDQEFEQMLYNKFDFMHCEFFLFQIVLRIHQVLQIKKQIQGISHEVIEQIIELYCLTNNFNFQTQNKLSKQFSYNTVETERGNSNQKAKVFLSSSSHNNGSYSGNIRSTLMTFGKKDKKQLKDSEKRFFNQKNSLEDSKFSGILIKQSNRQENFEEIEEKKEEERFETIIRETLSSIRNSKPAKNRKLSQDVEIFDHDLSEFKKNYLDNNKSQDIKKKLVIEEFKERMNERIQKKLSSLENNFEPLKIEDDEEEIIGKISNLLGQYESTCQLHEENLKVVKRKSQLIHSTIFDEEYTKIPTQRTNTFEMNGIASLNQINNTIYKTQRLNESPDNKQTKN